MYRPGHDWQGENAGPFYELLGYERHSIRDQPRKKVRMGLGLVVMLVTALVRLGGDPTRATKTEGWPRPR
jgi:hypothetical protein